MDRCEGMINEIYNYIHGVKRNVFFFMLWIMKEFMISCISNPTGTN